MVFFKFKFVIFIRIHRIIDFKVCYHSQVILDYNVFIVWICLDEASYLDEFKRDSHRDFLRSRYKLVL